MRALALGVTKAMTRRAATSERNGKRLMGVHPHP